MPNTEPALETTTRVDRCPICGAREFRQLGFPGHPIGEPIFAPHLHQFGISRCACGLEFTNPRPSSPLLSRFYGSRIYDCHKMKRSVLADRNAQSLLNSMARLGPYSTRKRLLDFGCGGGHFLANAVNAGWSAMGFDIGQAAIETCRSHQLSVTDQFLELEQASFDVIVLNHVFEHTEEPLLLLRSLRNLLGSQGKLFIEVPNVGSARARLSPPILSRKCGFDERHRAFPIHLWYFTPTTITKLLRMAGFEPLLVTTRGMGLEELRLRKPLERSGLARNSPTRNVTEGCPPESLLQPAKDVLKKIFYALRLGENVLIAARPLG